MINSKNDDPSLSTPLFSIVNFVFHIYMTLARLVLAKSRKRGGSLTFMHVGETQEIGHGMDD